MCMTSIVYVMHSTKKDYVHAFDANHTVYMPTDLPSAMLLNVDELIGSAI